MPYNRLGILHSFINEKAKHGGGCFQSIDENHIIGIIKIPEFGGSRIL